MLSKEFKQALLYNPRLLFAVLAGIVMLILGLHSYTVPCGLLLQDCTPQPIGRVNAYEAVVLTITTPLGLLAPLLTVLPFAASYLEERATGFLDHILLRSSLKRYVVTKLFVNFVVGGLALALPITLLVVFTNVAYPRVILSGGDARMGILGPGGLFHNLYRGNPDMFMLTVILRSFIFGGIYATLGFAISTMTDSAYIVWATPLAGYVIISFMLYEVRLTSWVPINTFIPEAVGAHPSAIVIELVLIFLLSLGTVLHQTTKKRMYV